VSLIEVLIGLTLVAVLLSLATPSFVTAMQNRQIRTAAEAIQSGLQFARTEALRRNRIVRFELASTNDWVVGCDTPDTTMVGTEEACPATLQARTAAEGSSNASVAPIQMVAATGTEASSPVFTGNLSFTPLGRVTPGTLPGGNIAQYQVTNPAGGSCAADGGEMRCLIVEVSSTGLVRMCDPAVAAGDPRAC
jgi:type IV fimbrial biogenesis protein FimT